MEQIPLNDLAAQHAELEDELASAVRRVVDASRFIGGPDHDAFAAEFATFCGVRRAVPCSNGTDALVLALRGVCGQGDGRREVITVSYTFAATVEAILLAGYKPVLVDVEPDTFLIDVEAVRQAITPRTAAIIPVHLFGQMAPIDELCRIATQYEIPLIEDAAQAHGARWQAIGPGQRTAAATFSFFPGKNLGAWGDAGAVVTQDEALADRLTLMIDHGRTGKYRHEIQGGNARMDNLQAAILRTKLTRLAAWNEDRRRVARCYDELLADVEGCTPPVVRDGALHVYHQYVIRVENRDELVAALTAAGIGFGIHYALPIHEQPAFASLGYEPSDLPVSHALAQEALSLPMYPHLTPWQIEHVCGAVGDVLSPVSAA